MKVGQKAELSVGTMVALRAAQWGAHLADQRVALRVSDLVEKSAAHWVVAMAETLAAKKDVQKAERLVEK